MTFCLNPVSGSGFPLGWAQALVSPAPAGGCRSWPQLDPESSSWLAPRAGGRRLQALLQVLHVQRQLARPAPGNPEAHSPRIRWRLKFLNCKICRKMAGCGPNIPTLTGPWSRVSTGGSMTDQSLWPPSSRSWTWCVTCSGGHPPPRPFSMSEVWLGILCLDRLRTGQCYHDTLTSFVSSKNHEILFRYGRRFAFFVMLFMAISLSVAIAFSPNYIVYTILRFALHNN